ncbi:MAG: Asp-tRNA(Asn)/Glu-tRNA(Gln) amidotransferase subunit GatA [bacterium]
MKLNEWTIKQAAIALKSREVSSVDLTKACLEEIERVDPNLNAYLLVDADGALKAAREADKRLQRDEQQSRLDGIPLAIKDNILVAGLKATAGSKMLKNYTASYDATVVTRLKASGAVILGKTNMDEFAMGSSTENSAFQTTKNPFDYSRVPGGSSGGSAAAVSSHLAQGALGTDTGGSIRQPAALCGIVGLKPTYGRVSRYGAIAMASSLDQIGPLSKCVWDAAAILEAIEGADPNDATSAKGFETVPPELLLSDVKGKRLGLPKEYFIDGVDPAVQKAVEQAVTVFKEMGAEIVEISLPHASSALEVYYILMPAEVSSNLARFDGIRYGTRISANTLRETYRQTRGQLLGQEVKRRVMIGTYVLSSGYYDAYYEKAQKVRALIKQDFDDIWGRVDAVLSPTAPSTAFKFGEKINDPIAMYLSDIYTVSANLAGLPAISVPCGLANGLPVGMQLMGKPWSEATILSIAHVFESQTDWRAHRF